MRIYIILFLLCFLFLNLFFCHSSLTQESGKKVIQAIRINQNESPVIDGKLNDSCWQKANKVSDFIQFEPVPGAKPKEPTIACVLYDEERLYIGFECIKQDPKKIIGNQTRRDSPFFHDDYVEVFLDTFHDCRNCYSFAVNCLGTQADKRIANEGSMEGGGPMMGRSSAWDCGWEAKVDKNNNGWTCEMVIPFSELRFSKKGNDKWGINFIRKNTEFNEKVTWADVGNRELSVSKFGELEGLATKDLVTSRPIEFKPYGTVKPRLSPDKEIKPDLGVDIRYPLSTITTDFTLNPDFGQIEADPERINLEDVEQRLTEKRPFFQEGMELFQTPIELFYTRRVGIKDLKYGAKAVGRIGNYNIALLDCQSNDTQENIDPFAPIMSNETKNNYLVLRTQRDIGNNSSIGILGVNKQKADGFNRAASFDFNITLPQSIRVISQYAHCWMPSKNDSAYIISLNRESNRSHFAIGAVNIGKDFNVEPGFIERIDRKGFRISTDYGYRRDAKILKMLRGGIQYERLENHKGIKTNENRGLEVMMNIGDFFTFIEPSWYYHVGIDNEDIFYTDRTVFLMAGWSPPKWVFVHSPLMIGEQENKRTFFIAPGFTFIPTEKLKFETNIERLDRKGDRLMLNRRFIVNYQFIQQMSFRTILEMTRDDQRNIFALYAWEFKPENNFYIVYTDNKHGDIIDRLIFVKITYLLKWKLF
ncbi:MAG: DUF5916 domain-containing protein [bacterium]